MRVYQVVPLLGFWFVLLSGSALSSTCRAEDDAPSIMDYGLRGVWTGAELGLAVGYLSTGSSYESHEWRNLVLGVGVGALSGIALGISLGIVDVSRDPPRTGGYVLRDMGYGTFLGALTGTAVGALFMVDSGRAKDLLIGAAYGALFGAATGVVFGAIEGSSDSDRSSHKADDHDHTQVSPTLLFVEGSRAPLPGVAAIF
jgi:hypothetical protein